MKTKTELPLVNCPLYQRTSNTHEDKENEVQERAEDSKRPSVKGCNYSIILTTEEQISTCQN